MPLAPLSPAPSQLVQLLVAAGLKPLPVPIFLNFFRLDCPWCVTELPRMSQTYHRRHDLNVQVIGVAGGRASESEVRAFAAEKDWDFPLVMDPDLIWHSAFALERVPAVVMINLQGVVERTYQGATEQFVGILEQTIFAAAHGAEPPAYDMVGNGCAP